MRLRRLILKMYQRVRNVFIKPIRVFCFHQVSAKYNPLTMWECDWTQLDQFKEGILQMKKRYRFISLQEAHEKLKHNLFRFRKYAVLTSDDGYRSILNVLSWLEEQKIPITLFINSRYLDGQTWSGINEKQAKNTKADVDMLNDVCPHLYLSKAELFALGSHLVSIGLHGHEHIDATKQTEETFRENVNNCKNYLSSHPRYVPYFAYTWGKHTVVTDRILNEMNLVPVLVNGKMNFKNEGVINRICIDRKVI